MVEPSVFQSMSNYASLNQDDVVLDIGAGFGFLTRFLANKCQRVLSVELDMGIVKALREQVSDLPNVEIIEGNVLKVTIPDFSKVVSIPPYNISSRLLLWLFSRRFDCAVLILQKEFADRLVAPVRSENYGWLTVFAYYHAEIELLDAVPKGMFYPQPEIDSVIVRLTPWQSKPFKLKDEALFKRMVKALFTQRNRKVRNAITPFIKEKLATAKDAKRLADGVPFHDKRVRELAPEDFGALANALSD
jgi:16S rRNA (adenine1518-N6/adenine1519-N6)-dimethyltransferase